MLSQTFERYLKEFGNSLKFDIQQSANLYFLPFKALVGLYRDGLQQVQHRPAQVASKAYHAVAPTSQQLGASALKVYLAAEFGQRIGPSIKSSPPSLGSYIPASSIRFPLNEQGALSAFGQYSQSTRRAIA
jgi:hypothetical protein